MLAGVLTSNYMRGAITGLGLLNVWSALAELGDLFGSRPERSEGDPESDATNQP